MLLRAFFIWYLYDLAVPSLFLLLRPNIKDNYFNSFNDSSILVAHLTCLVLSIFLVKRGKKVVFIQKRPNRLLDFFNKRVFEVFLSVFFIVCLYFYLNYDMSFRHLNRIKNTNSLVTIMFALRPFFRLWILVATFRVLRDKTMTKRISIIATILGLSFYFSLTSASDVLTILMCTALAISRLVDIEKFYKVPLFSLKTFAVSVALLSVVYFGFANKKNLDQRINPTEFARDFGDVYLEALLSRLSVHAASTFIAFETNDYSDAYRSWFSEVVFTQINNAKKLIGISFSDEINTLARRNYFYLFKEARYASRTGTSPGFIASFLYMPFFPLNLIFGLALLRFVFTRLFHGVYGKIPNLLLFISVYTLMPFFDGFQHILFLVDPIAFSFFYFVFLTDNYVRK